MQFLVSAAIVTAATLLQIGYADYWFHVRTNFYNNPTNSLYNGTCCNTSCQSTACCTNDSCNLATRICFREADHPHTPEGDCTRGEFTYPYLPDILTSRSMIPVRGPLINAEIQLYIRISHIPMGSQIDFALPLSNLTIDEFYYDGSVAPITVIVPLTGVHGVAQTTIQIFYRCATNFYGSSCATYCQERDDETGHYTCALNGSRQCLNGYTDPLTNCTKQENGTKIDKDSQNPRNPTENASTSINVLLDNEPTRTSSEVLLSVANIVIIVISAVLDVVVLMGLSILAVTVVRMAHRQRRHKQGDTGIVLRNGKGNGPQHRCNTNFIVQREGALESATDHMVPAYERITNYIV